MDRLATRRSDFTSLPLVCSLAESLGPDQITLEPSSTWKLVRRSLRLTITFSFPPFPPPPTHPLFNIAIMSFTKAASDEKAIAAIRKYLLSLISTWLGEIFNVDHSVISANEERN